TKRLPKNVTVYENLPVTCATYGNPFHAFETAQGTIRAQKVIICAAGYLTRFGFFPNSAIPVYTFASMTRRLTSAELAKAGNQLSYGLIPANSFGTTVRRTTDDRLFLRNVYAYANNFRAPYELVLKAQKQQKIAFDRRWPELSSI